MQSGGPQGRQRAGEAEHVLELLDIALLPPELVVAVLSPARLSTPVAWIWPSGSGEIQMSFQAGGMPRAWMRSNVSACVISAPDGAQYPNSPPRHTRVIPGARESLRVSPATAAGPAELTAPHPLCAGRRALR
jgi:hypothetical protein